MEWNFNIIGRNKNKFLGVREKKVEICYKEEEIAEVFVFMNSDSFIILYLYI